MPAILPSVRWRRRRYRPGAATASSRGSRLATSTRTPAHWLYGTEVRASRAHVVLTTEGAAFFAELCAGRATGELMLRRPNGDPWRKSNAAQPMAEACMRAGIAPISIHGLRHTWASLAVMGGMPLMVVAKNLGHVDTRQVERHYGHLAPSYVVEAVRAHAPKFGFKPATNVRVIR